MSPRRRAAPPAPLPLPGVGLLRVLALFERANCEQCAARGSAGGGGLQGGGCRMIDDARASVEGIGYVRGEVIAWMRGQHGAPKMGFCESIPATCAHYVPPAGGAEMG